MRSVEVPEYEVHEAVRVDPSRTALIVGDMQNDFVKEGGTLVVPDAAPDPSDTVVVLSIERV